MLDPLAISSLHKWALNNSNSIHLLSKKCFELFEYDWLTPIYHHKELDVFGNPKQIFGGRPKQLFQNYFDKQHPIVLCLSGRGFGKTKAMSEYIKYWLFTESVPGNSILYVAPTYSQLRFLQTDKAGITHCMPEGYKPIQRGSKELYFEAFDVTMYFSSPDSFESSARGKNTSLLCFDELCAMMPQTKTEEMFDITLLSNRIDSKSYPKTLITTTPKSTRFLQKILTREDIKIIRGSSYENNNLSENALQQYKLLENTQRGREEIFAEVCFDISHNLFPPIHLHIDDKATTPQILNSKQCVIIALDPSLKTKSTNDDFGFIVASKIPNQDTSKTKMLIQEDLSGKYSMIEIQNKIIQLKQKYEIIGVCVEDNVMGETIHTLLKNVVKTVKATTASKSKGVRASLVSPYWELDRIIFKKEFKELQDQIFNFDPQIQNQKDDHFDAFVYAGIEIFNLWDQLKKFKDQDYIYFAPMDRNLGL